MLDDQLASSGAPALHTVDVACFPYCASAYWANVDISGMSHLLAWIEMLHQRPSFSTSSPCLFLGLLSLALLMQHRTRSSRRLRVTPVSSL